MKDSFVPITVAFGDGIGPEIMDSVLKILKESESEVSVETIEIGEKLYKKNYTSGIADDTWKALERTRVLLKAPITTPQGGGYKSLNVTLRKRLGLFANIRPSISYFPFVATRYPKMDLVIIRENEEDIYAGIEYRQTHNAYSSLKLISRTGSEKIIRYAFEYALKNKRKKVSCMSKDNIMKFSDGIFHKVFDEIKQEYPSIQSDHYIIDIGTARIADTPEVFDLIVTSNLYGDIISDVASQISGSVGLAGSSNIGANYAMFEAIHGSAPTMAGENRANPSGLLNACIMMLVHIGHGNKAALIENAFKKTIEDGMHTKDIFKEGISAEKLGTKEFTNEVIKRLGQKPSELKVAEYENTHKADSNNNKFLYEINTHEKKVLVGVDVFLDYNTDSPNVIAAKITSAKTLPLKLQTIATKGLKMWPENEELKSQSDHWCCRFVSKSDAATVSHQEIIDTLSCIMGLGIDFIKTENLYNFDNQRGYSLSQGE